MELTPDSYENKKNHSANAVSTINHQQSTITHENSFIHLPEL